MISLRALLVLGVAPIALIGCFDELRGPGCDSDADCLDGQRCVERVCVDADADTGPDVDVDVDADPDTPDPDAPDVADVPDGDVDGGCPDCVQEVFASASAEHVCARTAAGRTWCWGSNLQGQLGDPARQIQRAVPTRIESDLEGRPVLGISSGASHTCVLTDIGPWCWGDNSNGELGRPGRGSSAPSRLLGVDDAVEVSVGAGSTCLHNGSGEILCVGLNEYAQLGTSPEETYSTFVPRIIAGLPDGGGPVSVGDQFVCAIRGEGSASVLCWGSNEGRQLAISPNSIDCPIDGGPCFSAAPIAIDAGTAVAVTAGGEHACAVTADEEAWCWGANEEGQIGVGSSGGTQPPSQPALREPIQQVSAGRSHTCATSGDSVYCWGDNSSRQCRAGDEDQITTPAVAVRDATDVTAGRSHTCALRSSGGSEAICWGDNSQYQLGDEQAQNTGVPAGTGLVRVRWIDAGDDHTCAVDDQDDVWCWGANKRGQLGDAVPLARGTPFALPDELPFDQLAVGDTHTCAVRGGSAFCWGENNTSQLGIAPAPFASTPVRVGGLSDVVEVGAGERFSCARTAQGQVFCWGANGCGRLGLNSARPLYTTPTEVADVPEATALAVGPGSVCVISAGDVWCWGQNFSGQLGGPHSETVDCGGTPVVQKAALVIDLEADVVSVAVGTGHLCAADRDGRLHCMGRNVEGQLGVPGAESSSGPVTVDIEPVKLVVAGDVHTCALTSTGAVYCWGYAADGSLGAPADDLGCEFDDCQQSPVRVEFLPPAASLAAGRRHTCAATMEGEVRCWGQNGSGQVGDGSFEQRNDPAVVIFPE